MRNLSNFNAKVNQILEPYHLNTLNPSGKDPNITLSFQLNGPVYESKSLLFFTNSPHLFLAFQKDEMFTYQIFPYKNLLPETIIRDVCEFAKTLNLDQPSKLDYAIKECKKLYKIIDNEFVATERTQDILDVDGFAVPVITLDSPFLILEDELKIEGIFNKA